MSNAWILLISQSRFSCPPDLPSTCRSSSCWFCLIGPATTPFYCSRKPVTAGGCDLNSGPNPSVFPFSTQTRWPSGEDDAAGGERWRRWFWRGGLPRTVPRRVQLRRRVRKHQRTICVDATLYHHYGLVKVSLSPLYNHLQLVLIIFPHGLFVDWKTSRPVVVFGVLIDN
jgi:hypothetical protein